MKKQSEASFRSRCRFEVSFRYELFYSLNVLLDPNSRIHPSWRNASRNAMGEEFESLLAEIGGSWEVWPVLASLLPGEISNPSFDELLGANRGLPISDFKEKILRGLIHVDEAVSFLLEDKGSLNAALAKIPKAKKEWISHIGLFPYDPQSPQIIALEKLLANAELFRELLLRLLEIYWQKAFQTTWERMVPQLKRSSEAKERLFHSCSFSEFSKQALLRVEVDEGKGEIGAIRGGYRLPFQDVRSCTFLPSAFNDRRFWSAFQEGGHGTVVYFPYFDPAITLDLQIAGQSVAMVEAALDPALIFKALGDSTRFAIAAILARNPSTSVELAKALSVSKPTISHHIHLLREAGLIQETVNNGSVLLQLRRAALERLSDLTVSKLFHSDKPLALIRTRGGAVS